MNWFWHLLDRFQRWGEKRKDNARMLAISEAMAWARGDGQHLLADMLDQWLKELAREFVLKYDIKE